VPQVLFPAERDPLALRVNGRQDPGAIAVEDLLAEGRSWGIPRSRAADVVSSTLESIRAAVENIGDRHGAPASLPLFLLEQTENLLRGDPAWTRRLPPAIALSGID